MSQIQELYRLYLRHASVQTDSRKIQKGDLFFALKGPHFNGNAYAAQALKDGAAYAVVDDPAVAAGGSYFLVPDVLDTLQQLARYHREQLSIPFLAITGSNGKTTTKELIHAVFSAKYKTAATAGNLNNHIGVPLTLLAIKPGTEMAIIEMGANHQKEIAAYCEIARPGYGLITNCGKAHLEGFGGIEGVRKAKGELYDFIRAHGDGIFRNADLDYLEKMAKGIENQITYGSANAQVIGRAVGSGPFLRVAVLTAGMEVQIQTRLVGDYNLANVLAAVTAGHYFGIDIDTIKTAIEQYTPANNRSQWITRGNNEIILDAYNANPSSMKLALENMSRLPHDNKWLLLGAMKEMGSASAAEHQALVDLAESLQFTHVILCGPEYKDTHHSYQWFADSEAVKTFFSEHPLQHALILIKGSRGARMETILDAF